ncbi:hypothetical protein D9M69_623550 [compost metagenome]
MLLPAPLSRDFSARLPLEGLSNRLSALPSLQPGREKSACSCVFISGAEQVTGIPAVPDGNLQLAPPLVASENRSLRLRLLVLSSGELSVLWK